MVSRFVVSWFPLGVSFFWVGLGWEEAGQRGWGGCQGALGGSGTEPFEFVVRVAALVEMG